MSQFWLRTIRCKSFHWAWQVLCDDLVCTFTQSKWELDRFQWNASIIPFKKETAYMYMFTSYVPNLSFSFSSLQTCALVCALQLLCALNYLDITVMWLDSWISSEKYPKLRHIICVIKKSLSLLLSCALSHLCDSDSLQSLFLGFKGN